MSTIKYIHSSGDVTEVQAEVGENLMSLAVNNLVDGIVGECGGAQACATCHCYLNTKYAAHFGEISEMENAMLEMVGERKPTSRLSCQLEITEEKQWILSKN